MGCIRVVTYVFWAEYELKAVWLVFVDCIFGADEVHVPQPQVICWQAHSEHVSVLLHSFKLLLEPLDHPLHF
jgi:hypothetical protein